MLQKVVEVEIVGQLVERIGKQYQVMNLEIKSQKFWVDQVINYNYIYGRFK
jgi:hypothetical protein